MARRSVRDQGDQLGLFGPSEQPKKTPEVEKEEVETKPKPAPLLVDEVADDDRQPTVEETIKIGKRRRTTGAALVALALVGAVFLFTRNDPSTTLSDATIQGAGIDTSAYNDTEKALFEDLNRASNHYSQNNTYEGFTPTAPISAAVGGTAIVLVYNSNEGCYFTGIAPGVSSTIQNDPSGEHCQPEVLAGIQQELSQTVSQIDENAQASGLNRLNTAAEIARYYATNNFTNGVASFTGIDAYTEIIKDVNVKTVAPDGSTVTLSTNLGNGNCLLADLTTTGMQTRSEPC